MGDTLTPYVPIRKKRIANVKEKYIKLKTDKGKKEKTPSIKHCPTMLVPVIPYLHANINYTPIRYLLGAMTGGMMKQTEMQGNRDTDKVELEVMSQCRQRTLLGRDDAGKNGPSVSFSSRSLFILFLSFSPCPLFHPMFKIICFVGVTRAKTARQEKCLSSVV